MKNTSLKIVTLLCLLIGMACGDKTTTTLEKQNAGKLNIDCDTPQSCSSNTVIGNPGDTLSEAQARNLTKFHEAKENIQRYVSYMTTKLGNDPILNGVGLNTKDLMSALGYPFNPDNDRPYHARCYIGMDENNGYKLYIVPVVGIPEGDTFSECTPGCDAIFQKTVAGQPDDQLYVLELNYPCPKVCAANSIFQ